MFSIQNLKPKGKKKAILKIPIWHDIAQRINNQIRNPVGEKRPPSL